MAYRKKLSNYQLQRRQEIEYELSEIPSLDSAVKKLLSFDGFVDYFLEMKDLYPSQIDAYEELEIHYQRITGVRRYSEYYSFRVSLDRYLLQLRFCKV